MNVFRILSTLLRRNMAVSYILNMWKVKQSHYRPRQALRVPGGWGSQISRQSIHKGGKVVSPTHRPPLPPRKYSWYSFLLEAESNPGPEGLCQWKIPMTPSGIEPATFRLVAQCLNQLRHRVPPFEYVVISNMIRSCNSVIYVKYQTFCCSKLRS